MTTTRSPGTTAGTTLTLSGGVPTLARRELAKRLRQLRETTLITGKPMTQAQVVLAGFDSTSALSRIERGNSSVKVTDVWALCRIYGVTDEPTIELLADLARGTTAPEWWESYPRVVVPDSFGILAGLEAAAGAIRAFHPSKVHGLLQTPEYARVVLSTGRPRPTPDVVDQAVEFRMRRQRMVLDRGATLTVVLDAGVLQRETGGPDVLAAQVHHLHHLDATGQAQIRIIPFTIGDYENAGAYAHLSGFTHDQDDAPVIHTEVSGGSRYLEHPDQITTYEQHFAYLTDISVPIREHAP